MLVRCYRTRSFHSFIRFFILDKMEMQQPNSDEPKTPSWSQQDSIDNSPEEQQSGYSEQPADYSQTTPWQLREQASRHRATERDQPVPTRHLTAQSQGAVEEPTPTQSQDDYHARNSGAVVMTINEKNCQGVRRLAEGKQNGNDSNN